jgi:hypothetical protein
MKRKDKIALSLETKERIKKFNLSHESFTDSKCFLVESGVDNNDGSESLFFAWRDAGKIFSLDYIPQDYPMVSVTRWGTLEIFAKETIWHDWIYHGINNNELRKMVDKFKGENDD